MTTNKLDGIKPGDRVRVTMEGTAGDNYASPGSDAPEFDRELRIQWDGSIYTDSLRRGMWEKDTFQIERIEAPIAVGDMVEWYVFKGEPLLVIALHNGAAWLGRKDGTPFAMPKVSELKRVAP